MLRRHEKPIEEQGEMVVYDFLPTLPRYKLRSFESGGPTTSANHMHDINKTIISFLCLYAIVPYATHAEDASSPVRIFLFSRTFSCSPSFPFENKKHSTYPNLPFRHN